MLTQGTVKNLQMSVTRAEIGASMSVTWHTIGYATCLQTHSHSVWPHALLETASCAGTVGLCSAFTAARLNLTRYIEYYKIGEIKRA